MTLALGSSSEGSANDDDAAELLAIFPEAEAACNTNTSKSLGIFEDDLYRQLLKEGDDANSNGLADDDQSIASVDSAEVVKQILRREEFFALKSAKNLGDRN